ncbi:response regulator, partial [Anaeromyxobacter sp. PSR-1]|uniref:response regulator n=1 Tax=Anaeromyxobacter sp. PSR-1 TaxID=1300915 RepID=UPI00126A2D56
MEPTKRVLIVEPDHAFALSLASLFHEDGCVTRLAASAAEAELEVASHRPDLCVVRAELPDLSGFSLCAQLRHDRATARLPVILYASETAPEALAEHARTPWAANGYLAMPLDTEALRKLAGGILAAAEPEPESADDAVLSDDEVQALDAELDAALAPEARAARPEPEGGAEVAVEAAPEAPEAAAPPPAAGEAPPPVPRKPLRSTVTDEDRLFVDRVFQSISERREDLLAEAHRRRPPPRRELLQTPEGRAELLREDLRWREAQLARLGEIWAVRERELASFDARMHEREVELQAAKLQVDDLLRRLAGARDLFVEKEREFGASIDGLLLEKFGQEKELIEVVAGSERRIHELEREVRRRDDDLAHRKVALDRAQEEIVRMDRAARAEAARAEARERELQDEISRRTEEVAAADEALAQARRAAEDAAREAAARLEEQTAARRALEEDLARAQGEAAASEGDHERRHVEAAAREAALTAERDRLRTESERDRAALEERLKAAETATAEVEAERDRAQQAARENEAALQARIDEREDAIREREQRLRLLDEEYKRFRDTARGREDDLGREIQDHLQQIGSLEGEIEGLARELAEREEEARAEGEALR